MQEQNMSGQTLINQYSSYWAPASIVDEINQLQETSAVATNNQTTNAISRWATSATGPSSDHNLLLNSNVILDDDGNISGAKSITLTKSVSNPGTSETIWINNSNDNLMFGSIDLSSGSSGNVVGPNSSVSGGIPSFNGTTGKIIQDSLATIFCDPVNSNLIISDAAITKPGDSSNLLIGHNAGGCCTGTGAGDYNICLGDLCGQNLTADSLSNILIGSQSAQNATSNNNCIYISNDGVAAESNTIRIGNLSHNRLYLYGVVENSNILNYKPLAYDNTNNNIVNPQFFNQYAQRTYLSGSFVLNIPSAGTAYNVAFTPSSDFSTPAFTFPSAGLITYNSTYYNYVKVTINYNVTLNTGTNCTVNVAIGINGALQIQSLQYFTVASTTDYHPGSLTGLFPLGNGDVISIMAANGSTTDGLHFRMLNILTEQLI